mmetsp:Transcript_27400/g.37760  ORF Transcript_27400/g.37760 Transcript_27400/m.37760 type:complete len:599 (-) Transcript_27400:64-1860(-)
MSKNRNNESEEEITQQNTAVDVRVRDEIALNRRSVMNSPKAATIGVELNRSVFKPSNLFFSTDSPSSDVSVDNERSLEDTPVEKKRLRNANLWGNPYIMENEGISEDNEPNKLLYNNASWFSCYINLTSTIIGAGILGVPYAFSKAGWILGTFLLSFCAVLSVFGLHLLSVCAKKVKIPSSFHSVASISIPKFSICIDIAVCMKCLGITTSYFIVIGDSLPIAMQQLGTLQIFHNRQFCLFLCFCILGPLSFYPKLDSLKMTSIISALMIISLVTLIFLYSLHTDALDPCADFSSVLDCVGDTSLVITNLHTLKSFPIMIFSFSCQQNTFAVVNELALPTQSRVDSVFVAATVTALALYLVVAYCGYMTYGSNLNSDILKMYPENDITSLSRIMVSFIVSCHYPLQMNPYRKSMLSLLNIALGPLEETDNYYRFRYFAVTAITLLFTFTVAVMFDDLGVAFSVVGATGSTLVIFILPGIFYYTIHKARNDLHDRSIHHCRSVESPLTTDCSSHSVVLDEPKGGNADSASSPIHGSQLLSTMNTASKESGKMSLGYSYSSLRLEMDVHPTNHWKTNAALAMFITGAVLAPLSLFLIFYV